MDYADFSAEDFALDEHFQQWVLAPDTETARFWQRWLQAHPEKESAIREAEIIVQQMSKDDEGPAPDREEIVWTNIYRHLQEEGFGQTAPVQPRRLPVFAFVTSLSTWQKVAAGFAGFLLVASLLLMVNQIRGTRYTTGFAQTENITLPDGSEVTLNANSSLRLPSSWNSNQAREVWLEGEAFFHVRKKPGAANARFIVHTGQLRVEVLGTQFNVNNRRGKTKVVLTEGKVQVNDPDKGHKLMMQPGDYVEYSGQQAAIARKKVDPSLYSSWKNNRLIFTDTPLGEIAHRLEDHYGVQVVFKDASLQELAFTGNFPANDLPFFLQVLSRSLNISVIRDGNQLIIDQESENKAPSQPQ